jgi:pantetheine-phosphate adenylyltransferase
VLVRGLRDITDFTYEFDMAMMNRRMAPEVDSVFLMTELSYLIVSATRMRELASLGRDVSEFVPPGVNEALTKKLAGDA